MKGLDIPDPEEDFTADPVELFFDLAFVFAFSQLVGFLIEHPDWAGVGQAALVFTIMWLGWSQITWAANAVAGNSRPARIVFLIATAASVPMAADVGTAFDDGAGLLFAIPIVVITQLGLALVYLAARGDEVRMRSARNYSYYLGFVSVVLIVGGILDDTARVIVWAVGMAIFLVGTWRASDGEWTMRAGHFAERHGLIIIVALGEVIVAVGKPLVDSLEEGQGVPAAATTALVAAGVFACLLWWSYFDRVQPALEHRVDETTHPARAMLARDNYTYAHLPMVAGVVAAAAAIEEITLHPDDPLPTAFRVMLFGGLAMFLVGIGAAAYRTFRAIAVERLLGVVAIGLLVLLARDVDGVWLIVILNAIWLAVLVVEHVRVEVRPRATA